MAYCIDPTEDLRNELLRVSKEQTRKALESIETQPEGVHEAVHDARKRCKKIRALLRLYRPALDDYREANIAFRDAARLLSHLRDLEAVRESYDEIMDAFGDNVDRRRFATVKAQLTRERNRFPEREIDLQLDRFRTSLREALELVQEVAPNSVDSDALIGGLRKTYARGRSSMKDAYAAGTAEAFHEWRKRVKYHMYHLRLLEAAWRPMLAAREQQTSELADALGDDHDLYVLESRIEDMDVDASVGAHFAELMVQRSVSLRARARRTGQLLFAESPDALEERFASYWESTASI